MKWEADISGESSKHGGYGGRRGKNNKEAREEKGTSGDMQEKEIDRALKNNVRMDQVIELGNGIQDARKQAEKEALETFLPKLKDLFPNDCKRLVRSGKDKTVVESAVPVSQDDLIRKFLKKHSSEVCRNLLKGKLGNVAKIIFTFFKSSDFTQFLGLKTDKEKGMEKSRVEKLLKERSLNKWSNETELQKAGSGTRRIIDDLEEMRQAKGDDADTSSNDGDAQGKDIAGGDQEARSDTNGGYFGAPDYKETIDDVAQERQGSIEKLKQMRNVKDFEELLILLNEPDFPGIQGSKQFYSGDDLRRIVAGAREMGVTNFVTSSQGLRDTVERLLRQEKEGKIGAMKEDGIVEGFGVVGGVVPEIVSEEKDGDSGVEASSETRDKNALEGEYPSQGEESTQELRSRARELKIEADAARDDYLKLKHRNESKWLAVKRALFASRPKEPPENLVDELSVSKVNWNHKLTLYKNAVVELAKREAEDRKLDGKGKGLLMAEAIRGLDFQGSIENYNAWKDAAWGNREDSLFLRGLGRAKNWAEQYRTLDWKKRMAISALALGTGVAGVATGSAGLVGLGVAGSTLIRLLGSYGVGRVSYEYLEGRANRKTVQYHEAALSNVEKIDDIRFLEQRMKSYADRTQENLDRAIAGNRKRVVASVALGTLLFAGGSALAHQGAIREVSGKVSSGFSKFLEQMKIITGIEDFHDAPIQLDTSPPDVPPLQPPQLDVSVVHSLEAGERVTDFGIVNPDQVAGNIGKSIAETGTVPKGGSFEGVLIEKLTESGSSQGDAGKLAHRAMLDFAEKSGKSFDIFNHAQPGDGISYETASDGSVHVIDVTRKMSGEVIKQVAESVSRENIPNIPTVSGVEPFSVGETAELKPINPGILPEIHNAPGASPAVLAEATSLETVPDSSAEPSLATKVVMGVGAGGLAIGGAALLGGEVNYSRAQRRDQQQTKEKGSVREIQEKAREVFLQVADLTQIPEDRQRALWILSGEYGAYEKRRPSDEVFEETRKKIAAIVFGSEDIPEDILDNMFLSVAQRGIGDPENKNLEEIRTGIKNGYSVFQVLFGRTGDRLPAGRIAGLSVRDVLRLFTERFLTGKIPEELRNSGT